MSIQELWAKKKPPTQSQIDIIYEQMAATIKVFNRAGINYHIIAGSALGQARCGGLIPWDDDVDFGIHRDDAANMWNQREYLGSLGYGIVHADIGFRMGTGSIIPELLTDVDGTPTAVGAGTKPFTGVNQDIFLFNENGSENGIPVMRYSSKRAIETWPREVIPVKGWYSPTDVIFGGYNVKIPSKKYLDWYLEYAYGENWKTHDGFGNEISKVPCALHSSIMSTNINK
tara:strand:- start:4658 stop:5344 length:687 start_codon:yes stop_codon:yes gene_type:complete